MYHVGKRVASGSIGRLNCHRKMRTYMDSVRKLCITVGIDWRSYTEN